MKLQSRLPVDRAAEGTLWATDEQGVVVFGPVRARGEADLKNAAQQDNIHEDPTRIGGDHPAGMYRVADLVPASMHKKPDTYGPWFIRINPVSGEAWEARQHGRSGFGIHGGKLLPGGQLRPTFGCLRTEDDAVETLAITIAAVRSQAPAVDIFYECVLA